MGGGGEAGERFSYLILTPASLIIHNNNHNNDKTIANNNIHSTIYRGSPGLFVNVKPTIFMLTSCHLGGIKSSVNLLLLMKICRSPIIATNRNTD